MNPEISPVLPIAGARGRLEVIYHDNKRTRERFYRASNRFGLPRCRPRAIDEFETLEDGYL